MYKEKCNITFSNEQLFRAWVQSICFFSFSERKKGWSDHTFFLSQLEGKWCYSKLNIFSSLSTVGHTKTICLKHCKMDTNSTGLSQQHPKSSTTTIFSLSLWGTRHRQEEIGDNK